MAMEIAILDIHVHNNQPLLVINQPPSERVKVTAKDEITIAWILVEQLWSMWLDCIRPREMRIKDNCLIPIDITVE